MIRFLFATIGGQVGLFGGLEVAFADAHRVEAAVHEREHYCEEDGGHDRGDCHVFDLYGQFHRQQTEDRDGDQVPDEEEGVDAGERQDAEEDRDENQLTDAPPKTLNRPFRDAVAPVSSVL